MMGRLIDKKILKKYKKHLTLILDRVILVLKVNKIRRKKMTIKELKQMLSALDENTRIMAVVDDENCKEYGLDNHYSATETKSIVFLILK